MMPGTPVCTMVASATRGTVDPVARRWNAPPRKILLMTSVILQPSRTTNCNTMPLSVRPVGNKPTPWIPELLENKRILRTVTTTLTTSSTRMAARCMVAMVPCLGKIVRAVVFVITPAVHANVSVATLVLLVRRWRRWHRQLHSPLALIL